MQKKAGPLSRSGPGAMPTFQGCRHCAPRHGAFSAFSAFVVFGIAKLLAAVLAPSWRRVVDVHVALEAGCRMEASPTHWAMKGAIRHLSSRSEERRVGKE